MLLGFAAVLTLLLLAPTGRPQSDDIRQVFVTNFPDPQRIKGEVTVATPIRLAELASFRNILVPPVQPSETTRLVSAGVLTTDGFPALVLSLHGQVKGNLVKGGSVGAILIPNEEPIQQAFQEQGLTAFALEVRAGLASSASYFASEQPRHVVAFPSYRVLLYNTTEKTVSADLYAYLTN